MEEVVPSLKKVKSKENKADDNDINTVSEDAYDQVDANPDPAGWLIGQSMNQAIEQ